ncbi:hypothetical protein TNIN_329781 [Trichonephila inaurata madagascariensis]|uniref:Uncharacterized protein n=1 Tax=Trichonephila inaurata madagascariensis TaxID=2747483 RepID=A0A8X6MCF5_9ARAC|nr:hypothetical protein TNIN_329781 [Trichonephila inaurata madagascariensis]
MAVRKTVSSFSLTRQLGNQRQNRSTLRQFLIRASSSGEASDVIVYSKEDNREQEGSRWADLAQSILRAPTSKAQEEMSQAIQWC